jgi:hypothetical protein
MKHLFNAILCGLMLAATVPAGAFDHGPGPGPGPGRGRGCYDRCNEICLSPHHAYRSCMRECTAYCPRRIDTGSVIDTDVQTEIEWSNFLEQTVNQTSIQ